jgi:hypothetical protein
MNTMTQTHSALRALDVGGIRLELEAIDARLSELRSARERGLAETSKIAREQHERRNRVDGANPTASADALVAGEAARNVLSAEQLQARKVELQAGVNELARRIAEAERERGEIINRVREMMAAVVEPLAKELEQQARQVVLPLAELYATASAIRAATGSGDFGLLAQRLSDGLHELAMLGFLREEAVAVPGDVLAMLQGGADAMALADTAAPSEILYPLVSTRRVPTLLGIIDKAA